MNPPSQTGYIAFPDERGTCVYADPIEIITARAIDEVIGALARVEARVEAGYHAAGYLAYEAAPAFDPAFQTHEFHELPLLWFGIYTGSRRTVAVEPPPHTALPAPTWNPSLDRDSYDRAIDRIRDHIAAGDTYQVNYTFPTSTAFSMNGRDWFQDRQRAQRGAYSAYLDLGSHEVLSLSPELFFALDGDTLTSRPMKGTRPRGLSVRQDSAMAEELHYSPKERAENLMIVDMLRNDLGRVCAINSIRVPSLFSIEQYPTVWQMTSTVSGQTKASVSTLR